MNPVRVAVVGAGYLGRFHAEKHANLCDVELVGIVDIDYGKAQQLAKRFNVSAYRDFKELFGKVDAVSVVVPTHLHYEIARQFLSRNIDVLLEKPMTATLTQADDLIRIASNTGAILQVGHLERFNPAIVAIRKFLKQPLFVESHRLAQFKDRGTEVDVILDLMIHDIDIILNAVNSPVIDIHAVGVPILSSKIDIANVRLQFQTGCVANVTASRISAKEMRKIRIFQNDAYFSIDYAAQDVSIYRKVCTPADGDDVVQIMYEKIDIQPGDALEQEIKAFVQSVRERRKPQVSGEEARDALHVALEITKQINAIQSELITKL